MTTEETTPRPAPKTAAAHWAEQVEQIKTLDQDGFRVVLWDADSAAQDNGTVAAGVLQLPDSGFSLERLAFALRDTLQQVTGDPSISVGVRELDDATGTGDAQDWARRGVAEFNQVSPYIADPWYDERDPEDDEDRAEHDAQDEELLNELAQLGAELAGHNDEDEEPAQYYDYCPHGETPGTCVDCIAARHFDELAEGPRDAGGESQADEDAQEREELAELDDEGNGPSEEEQAALMRESLESAEDIRNYPDGTRFLPSYDQDQA